MKSKKNPPYSHEERLAFAIVLLLASIGVFSGHWLLATILAIAFPVTRSLLVRNYSDKWTKHKRQKLK